MKIFKKKDVLKKEIDELSLKKLKMFEDVDANYNELGFAVNYLRVPGGLIRTTINEQSMSQIFIPIDTTYFV